MGSRGLDPGKPKPPDDTCDGPSIEPPVDRVLLRAWADGASEDLCVDEAIWPRVLMPVDNALSSDTDVVATPAG
jgi:hypothetical protein